MRGWMLAVLLNLAWAQNSEIPLVSPVVPEPDDSLGFEHEPLQPQFASVALGRLIVRFAANEGSVARAAVRVADQAYPMHPQLLLGSNRIWRASLPASVRDYSIWVQPAVGAEEIFGPFVLENPPVGLDWVAGSVGYQVFPERFWNGDPTNDAATLANDEYNFNQLWNRNPQAARPFLSGWSDRPAGDHCCHQYFGGDLEGFIQKLPHLVGLGVSLVYFNPLFEAGSAHGYDTHDYYQVAAKFGGERALRRALDLARQRGIRVIFDFVPNHTGIGFFAFQDVIKNGEKSPYYNWYFIKKWPFIPGDANSYEAWGGFGSLPRLNTANPEVRQYLYKVAAHWIGFGFDGLRVDVANEILGPETFFPELRQAVRAVNPQAYLVAEIWGRDASWLQGDQFDSLMNYAIGRDILLRYARGGSLALYNGRRAQNELSRVYLEYSEAAASMGFNLIDSHDTARMLSELGGGGLFDTPGEQARARQKLAVGLLYALPGVPFYFQGNECAFTGEKPGAPPYELYRYPMQWDRCDPATLAWFQKLGQLRRQIPALNQSAFRVYAGEGGLLAFWRGEPGPNEVLVVAQNQPALIALALPEGTWRDLWTGESVAERVVLDGIGFRYLQRQPPR